MNLLTRRALYLTKSNGQTPNQMETPMAYSRYTTIDITLINFQRYRVVPQLQNPVVHKWSILAQTRYSTSVVAAVLSGLERKNMAIQYDSDSNRHIKRRKFLRFITCVKQPCKALYEVWHLRSNVPHKTADMTELKLVLGATRTTWVSPRFNTPFCYRASLPILHRVTSIGYSVRVKAPPNREESQTN